MTKFVVLLVLLFSLPLFAQRDTLQGRIVVAGENTPGVFVINKQTKTEVKTGKDGLFKIAARQGDRLVVYSDRTVVREFYISNETFKTQPYVMEVDPQSYQLDEVLIDRNITPESLGLVPEGQKRYTVAERRLKTAGEFKPSLLFFLGGGISFPLDPIINAITGRTKMLKKELETERKQMGMEEIGYIYSEEQIVSQLRIPAEKVQAFLFFAVEDAELLRAIKNKNEDRAKLELAVLAARYLELQKEEQKTETNTNTSHTIQKPNTNSNEN